MKVSLEWLRRYLPELKASVEEISVALTSVGLEIEGIEDFGAPYRALVVAKVQSCERHPEADKLSVTQVFDGQNTLQVVCGAPNVAAGQTVVFAPLGSSLPMADGTELKLKKMKLRGIESSGMICAEDEIGLGNSHAGILVLDDALAAGTVFAELPGTYDVVFEVNVTPNRPDALGVRGIARDLAARGLGTLKPLDIPVIKGTGPSKVQVHIDPALTAKGCPHFAGRTITGVKNGASPAWLADRLKAIGLRPISTLVDITNYFTYGLNRPLHVFDAAKVKGALRIHPAKGGEELLALDGKTYTIRAGQMLISDDHGPESLAGIMGGEASGCTPDTTEVFLESAFWDPITVAATGRALKINSDARYRFERGVDPQFTLPGLDLATQMILDLCGGTASDLAVDGAAPDATRVYHLDPARVISLVGMDIPEAEQRKTLISLGFTLNGNAVTPPSWRPDVLGDADLIEEIARVASLTKLQGKPLVRAQTGVPRPVLTPMQIRERTARRTIAALGYNECVTYSFIDSAAATLFGGGSDAVMIENPISSEMTHLRPDLLPGLLRAAARNQARGFADMALFEIGPAFHGGEPGEQHLQATGLLIGASAPRDPHAGRRSVDIFDTKADVEAVLAALGAPARAQITRKVPAWFHPGRAGTIGLGPTVMATFGELHPKVLAAMDVKGPAMAFTVLIANLPQPKVKTPTRAALTLSDLQAVDRDFAFVVDHGVEALTAVNAALGADKALIESVRVFDQFTGDKAEAQMGAGKKSIALTVRLQPVDKTLTDAEIEAVSARIIDKVSKATGGTLRS